MGGSALEPPSFSVGRVTRDGRAADITMMDGLMAGHQRLALDMLTYFVQILPKKPRPEPEPTAQKS